MLPSMHFTLASTRFLREIKFVFVHIRIRVAFFPSRRFPIFHNLICFLISQGIPNSWRITIQIIPMNLFSRIWRIRAASGWIGSRPEGSVRLSRLPFPKPQRINPLHRIRRIRIKIQPTRIADRVFADKPSDPWIIVPIPIVVQPCFVIVVLPLKPDRVGQTLALCPFRALFFDFSPRAVLRAPTGRAKSPRCHPHEFFNAS